MLMKKLLGLCLTLMLVSPVFGDVIALAPDHPERYIVKQGDTLWDIAARFLRDPWRWPDVWEFNPQIENPHLIYPGDVIVLTYEDGKPVLRVQRGGAEEIPTTKLSPKVRRIQVGREIPTIPLDAIKQFLSRPKVISQSELENSPYIVATQGQHLVAGTGDQIYARGVPTGKESRYALYRTGRVYRNPGARDEDILGYEALYVGDANVKGFGDPATLQIVDSVREALIGDRLLPIVRQESDQFFVPHAPDRPIEGQIIELIDGVARIGQYQTVVLNVGELDGVERGHVLAVYQAGEQVRDVVSEDPRDSVTLPDIRSGVAMIFRTFDRVSYALIMKAERDMSLYDAVRNP
jgi:hypothetical protein